MNKWDMVQLSQLTYEYSKRNKNEENVPVYSVTNSVGFTVSTDYFSKEVFSKDLSTYKYVEKGMFAYNPSRINVGSIAWLNNIDKVIVSPLYVVFSVDINKILQQYLWYFIRGKIGISYINSLTSGSVRDSLKFTAFQRIFIPLPPLEVQRKIAETLDAASALLAMRKKQLAELDRLIQSVFYDMFGDLKQYDMKTLIDVILPNAGLSYGIVQPGEDKVDGIGIIRPVDIKNHTLNISCVKHIPKETEIPYKKTRLIGNEILITVRGTTGDVALTDYNCKNMNVTRGIAVIRQDDSIINRNYLYEYLKTDESQRFIQENTYGATLKQINLSVLRKLKIQIPPLNGQTQFAKTVQKIEEQKSLVQKAIDETQALFDSLMNEYFE